MKNALDFTEKQTILIVDDTPDNLTLMTGVLKDAYKTKVANNGERALSVASTHPLPDLILLDIMMPGIDGYEVCRRLKNDQLTADIPVIFLTAKTEVEDEQKGFDVGCVDYITKPISPPSRNPLATRPRLMPTCWSSSPERSCAIRVSSTAAGAGRICGAIHSRAEANPHSPSSSPGTSRPVHQVARRDRMAIECADPDPSTVFAKGGRAGLASSNVPIPAST